MRGMRFSLTDGVAIVLFASLAGFFWREGYPLWWMLVIAVGHFFLFCNVFRIARHRELIWAGLFVFNIGLWNWLQNLNVSSVLVCQIPITVVLIVADMRSPGYHGILAERLNPRLKNYLEGGIL